MNVIMNEMGGQFNGTDFNKMTEQQRSDWAIKFTNTILNMNGQSLETGEGQHGRSPTVGPTNADNVAPLRQ